MSPLPKNLLSSAPRSPRSLPLEQGQASVELLFGILLLVLLTLGGVALAQGISLRQALDSGTGVAVRTLSLAPSQWNTARILIQNHVDSNAMGLRPAVTVSAYDQYGAAISPAALSSLPFGSSFVLEASAPFVFDVPLLGRTTYNFRIRHWGIVERYP
jgi:hypothetical protein